MKKPDHRTMHKLRCTECREEVLYRTWIKNDTKLCKQCIQHVWEVYKLSKGDENGS